MTGPLKITGDMTKVIIDTPEGLVELISTKNDMQLFDGVLQPMVPAAEVRGWLISLHPCSMRSVLKSLPF